MGSNGSKRSQGQSLSEDERAKLSTRALELYARGGQYSQIARELEISVETVKRLLNYAADTTDKAHKDRVRASVEASAKAVKRRAWTELDRREPLTQAEIKAGIKPQDKPRIIKPTSHTLPQLLARILEGDDRLVRIYQLDQPDQDEMPTESLAEQMMAYEEAKRTGKISELYPDSNGHANGASS